MNGAVCEVEVVEGDGGPMLVVVRGDLDDACTAMLHDALERVSRNRRREVVVDLGAAEFLDSAVLSVLVEHAHRLHERDADLVLQSPSRIVSTVIDLTRTRHLFRIRETV
jgi:anti-anti-sigma factor